MEHSNKLPCKLNEVGDIVWADGEKTIIYACSTQLAEFLVKACNEHDTLTKHAFLNAAKADLHDELVKELENSTGQMRLITGFDQERKRRIETLLAKCKEIKK